MTKHLTAYVFDMGGVITKPARIKKMYTAARMSSSYHIFKGCFYHSPESEAVYKGELTDEEFFGYVNETCGGRVTTRDLISLYSLFKGGIYQETMQAIKDLKEEGNKIYLLSNIKKVDYDYLDKNIDLGLFDEMFLSYQLGMCKPHEDIYQHVIKVIGTSDFHFFDDSPENVRTAQELGINAHLTTGKEITKCLRNLR